ncbi:MAG: hypothetical protein AAFP17_16675 [Pseudomonadota bacterium]
MPLLFSSWPVTHSRRYLRPACLLAGLLGVAGIAASALAQNGLDLPDQIGTSDRSVGIEEILPDAAAPGEKVRIETITPEVDGTAAEQTEGGRDLCGPETSDAERRRLGIDCDALIRMQRHSGEAPEIGTARDPLLTPRDDEARRDFDALDLGRDVPATVILQQ